VLEKTVNAKLINEYGFVFFDGHLLDIAESILSKKNPALAEYQFRVQ